MESLFVIFRIAAIFISILFGGNAYLQFSSENMDEVYLNIGYSTLFLSIAVYLWHMKDEKHKNNS